MIIWDPFPLGIVAGCDMNQITHKTSLGEITGTQGRTYIRARKQVIIRASQQWCPQ